MDIAKQLRERAAQHREFGWEITREGDPAILEEAADELEALRRDYHLLRDSFTAIDSIVRAPDTLNAIFSHPRNQ